MLVGGNGSSIIPVRDYSKKLGTLLVILAVQINVNEILKNLSSPDAAT